jgi:tetratricopeptide (TPR) repeat protein
VDFASRRGITFMGNWVTARSLWMRFDLGRWEELLETADELIAWDDAYGGSQVGVMARSSKAQVLVHRGESAHGAALAAEFLPRAREIDDPQVLLPALATAALVAQAADDPASALRLVEDIDQATRGLPVFRASHLPGAVRIALAAGAPALAERLVERADTGAPRSRCSVLSAQARLAEARGELARARELYAAAASSWARFGHVLERGHALLGLGRSLFPLGDREGAAAMLSEARELFAGVGAHRLEAETAAAEDAHPALQ